MPRVLTLDEPGLTKICSWPAFYQDGLVQVPYVRKLATERLSSKEAAFSKVSKLQSKETAELVKQFLDSYPVKLGHSYFLDTALGAYEAWGPNSNADAFYEEDLLDCGPDDDYGYKSFKKHAHVFRGHANSNPELSIGKVVLAAYNPIMRRVEVIEELNEKKATDLLAKWDVEGSLGTSMGTKIPFDICMVKGCGNRAKTAAFYCEHMRYKLGEVWEDGQRVHCRNPRPRFFDHSHVTVPADKIAGSMMKIAASVGMEIDQPPPKVMPSALVHELMSHEDAPKMAKVASESPIELRDLTEYEKTAGAIAAHEAQFPAALLEELATFGLWKVASTLTAMGIVPSPREWQYLVLATAGQEKKAKELHAARVCFEPDPLLEISLTDADRDLVAPGHADAGLAMKLAAWLPLRSIEPMWLAPRMAVERQVMPPTDGLLEGVGVFTAAWDKVAKEVVPPEQIRKADPSLAETMLALAVSYGIIRAAQGEQHKLLQGLRETTGTNPAIAAALLAAGAAAALGLAKHAIPHEKKAAWVRGPSTGFWDWIRHTPEPIHSWVLPFGVGYMSSAWYRAKQLRGEPTTATQNVVADHPLASGIGAVAAVQAVRRALR